MVNEEQILESLYSLSRYYTIRLHEAENEKIKEKYLKKLSELDIEIYDLETYLNKDIKDKYITITQRR